MFISKNLRLLELTTGGAYFLKGLINNYNEEGILKKECIHEDNPWIHAPGDDIIYELIDKGLAVMIDPEYAHLVTRPEMTDLEINKDKLEEIENHFEVVLFHNTKQLNVSNNDVYGTVFYNTEQMNINNNNVCDIVFRMTKRSWLFNTI